MLVPEKFKKGVGIHFHCLCNDVIKVKFTGKYHAVKGGVKSKVYNVVDWRWGYSTALPISGSKERLCCYVTKYVTKNSNRLFGKYYLSSNNLQRDPLIAYGNTDFDSVDLEAYRCWRDDILFKYDSNVVFS